MTKLFKRKHASKSGKMQLRLLIGLACASLLSIGFGLCASAKASQTKNQQIYETLTATIHFEDGTVIHYPPITVPGYIAEYTPRGIVLASNYEIKLEDKTAIWIGPYRVPLRVEKHTIKGDYLIPAYWPPPELENIQISWPTTEPQEHPEPSESAEVRVRNETGPFSIETIVDEKNHVVRKITYTDP